jgi:hypothetical protein
MTKGEGHRRNKFRDGSPITNVGDDGEDVLGDEVVFRLGSDSSPPAQNDKSGGDYAGTGRILLRRGVVGLGSDSSAWPQNDNFRGDYQNDNPGTGQDDNDCFLDGYLAEFWMVCQARRVSATVQAWAMQPRGVCGGCPSKISPRVPSP